MSVDFTLLAKAFNALMAGGAQLGIAPLAKLLINTATEIQQNIKARGADAEKQFEEAKKRNAVSLRALVEQAGGTWPSEPTPQPEETDFYWKPLPARPARHFLQVGDRIYTRRPDGWFFIAPHGIGAKIPDEWEFVETIA